MRWIAAVLGVLVAGAAMLVGQALGTGTEVPEPQREFRGVWVATVDNIDWPSRPGLPVEQQKAELTAILDRAAALRLNAIIFQVRPACDALYASRLEPWSEFLTGRMGQAPTPVYDPLAFAVEESHRRGLELHAWFNPYRARHPAGKSEISADHISKTHPELVRQYGKFLWLDPGEKEVQEHSLAVIRDVVRRYDVDGVHIDDYFYPYKEKDAAGKILPFPDDPSWAGYVRSGGKLSRDDWRRENVNQFIRRMYRTVKTEKPWVKVGISPFGIWRPGDPPQIQGFDQYAELYADARKWVIEGWLDYASPQLYWPIAQTPQSYPILLRWWVEQNKKDRHLWPGNFTSRVETGATPLWPASEVTGQIYVTRGQPGATGNIHFSMKSLMRNSAGISDLLSTTAYAAPALVPASTWLDDRPPATPTAEVRQDAGAAGARLTWEPAAGEEAWLWVVQQRSGGQWKTEVLPGARRETRLEDAGADRFAVRAVDRCGNASRPAVVSR